MQLTQIAGEIYDKGTQSVAIQICSRKPAESWEIIRINKTLVTLVRICNAKEV